MSAPGLKGFLLAWFFITGAAIGSFLNVVIYRIPRGFHVGLPSRSACRTCKRKLQWFENIPILSYLGLRARCRTCSSPISGRYPLVEALTGVVFVAVYATYGFSWQSGYYCVFSAALIAITFIDLDFRIIPDVISLSCTVFGLVGSAILREPGIGPSLMAAVAGGLGFYLLAWGYEKATGREGLGFGDVKLLAMIGAFLGPRGVASTVLISSVVGSVFGLTIMVLQRKNMRMALPFGPFLAIAAFVFLFWGDYLGVKIYPLMYE